MKGFLAFALVAVSAASETATGQRGQAATASVEGDVFLLMQNGDTKKGTGLSVSLVPLDGRFEANLKTLCSMWLPQLADIQRQADKVTQDSAILSRQASPAKWAVDELEQLKRVVALGNAKIGPAFSRSLGGFADTHAVDSISSGLAAHYRFNRLRAGRYLVRSAWQIGDNPYEWWVPVTVKVGAKIVRDLDNSVEGSPFPRLCPDAPSK
jgi:hypothetical protein